MYTVLCRAYRTAYAAFVEKMHNNITRVHAYNVYSVMRTLPWNSRMLGSENGIFNTNKAVLVDYTELFGFHEAVHEELYW